MSPRHERGFTFVEVCLGMLILGIAASASFLGSHAEQQARIASAEERQALDLASTLLERMRAGDLEQRSQRLALSSRLPSCEAEIDVHKRADGLLAVGVTLSWQPSAHNALAKSRGLAAQRRQIEVQTWLCRQEP